MASRVATGKSAAREVTLPWRVPQIKREDLFALQALERGQANEGQQKAALALIRFVFCAEDKMEFYPGAEDGRRASDFAAGKRWVGLTIRRFLRIRPEMNGGQPGGPL